MKKTIYTLLTLAGCCGLNHAQNAGDLDINFGVSGYVYTDGVFGKDELFFDMAVLPNNKFIMAGYSDGTDNNILLMKFNSDGTPDSTFGNNSPVVEIDASLGANEQANTIEVLDNGYLLIGGSMVNMGHVDAFVMQLDANGSPDPNFGSGGKILLNAGSNLQASAFDLYVLPSGSILVGSYLANNSNYDMTVFKLTPGGELDSAFGTNGAAHIVRNVTNETLNALTVDANGKILVCGSTENAGNYDGTIVRLNSDGTPDNSFDGNGILNFDDGNGNVEFAGIVATADDKILVSGYQTSLLPNVNGLVIRFENDGDIDSSFSTDGIMVSDVGTSNGVYLTDIALQPDNRILSTGYITGSTLDQVYAIMLEEDGSPVSDFGTAGDISYDLQAGTANMTGQCMGLMNDGSILIGGYQNGVDFANDNLYLIKLQNHNYTGIENNTDVTPQVCIYPNPTSEYFSIRLADGEMLQQSDLYTLEGKQVQSWSGTSPQFTLPADLTNGRYILQVRTNMYFYSQDLMIVR